MAVIKDRSNLIGKVSGERVIIKDLGRKLESPKGRKTRHYVLVRCSCGDESEVQYRKFQKSSRCPSCRSRKCTVTHGKADTKVYKAWTSMKDRTSNPKATNYSHYGGRGIKMCERWNKFENFYEDMGEPPSNKHTLDRIDVDGNYCPENCRWATPKQQARNRRNTRWIEGKSLAEWEEITGIPNHYISYHADRDRSVESIVDRWNKKEEKKLLKNKIDK